MSIMGRCEVEELHEIHRDPGGHYHHWSILTARMRQGTLSVGDLLSLPTHDGSLCVARIGGFTAFRQQLGSSVSTPLDSTTDPDVIGIMVTSPAPPQGLIVSGDAIQTTEEARQAYLLYALEHHPERLFHNQGNTAFPCSECCAGIWQQPTAKPLLLAFSRTASPTIKALIERKLST